jgi:hypothetical protein
MVETAKKLVYIPKEEEIAEMIRSHLECGRSKKNTTICLGGYLAALLDRGLLEIDVYSRLSKLLPQQWGVTQVMEIFIGPGHVAGGRFPDEEE